MPDACEARNTVLAIGLDPDFIAHQILDGVRKKELRLSFRGVSFDRDERVVRSHKQKYFFFQCHTCPLIGIFTPFFSANSRASPYLASACRMIPIPGSVVSTRSMRFAIISVPSATVTCPACSEYPMPTPPPLCIETHDAPAAVLSKAFSKGQSATASLPSFMLSVSRKGEATEPQSR